MKLLDGVQATAVLSECGTYRYSLSRVWRPWVDPSVALWIMLNPSTADADRDDATLRKIQKFSQVWGYDALVVVNLFALRSREPAALRSHPDPVGPDNDETISTWLQDGKVTGAYAAWGAHGTYRRRDQEVIELARTAGRPLKALRLTGQGQPWHPLYLPDDTTPFAFGAPDTQ